MINEYLFSSDASYDEVAGDKPLEYNLMSWNNSDIGNYTYYFYLRVGDINATTVFKTREINIEITCCVTEWTYVS